MNNCVLPGAMLDPLLLQPNSGWDCLHRSAGAIVTKNLLVNPGGAAAQTYNIFKVTGTVEVVSLYGIFIDVTNVVTVTVVSYDLNDAVNTVVLTAAAGVNCSTAALGSLVGKTGLAAVAATFLNASQIRMNELALSTQFQGFIVTAKSAVATNYIRFKVTTDVNTNCRLLFYANWIARSSTSALVAA